ncbi:MAG TPA: hydrogenase maturation nickel metallochaperone HypA [Pirellulales bacterium]|jgi:hydrogenase nickel incorporation protein HypA/HybF|nr:hydrogenase maturation nickel metallochaperone HypA [Pirellulales bacterium]
MHELSIACSLIDTACEAAAREGDVRVTKLTLRVGALSGIVKESLLFCFEQAAEGGACEGAALEIEEVAVTAMCPRCQEPKKLADYSRFCCPECGTPTPQIVSGQELELVSLEILPDAAAHP